MVPAVGVDRHHGVGVREPWLCEGVFYLIVGVEFLDVGWSLMGGFVFRSVVLGVGGGAFDGA